MSDLTFRVKVLLDFLIYSPKGRILINGYYNKISVNQVAAYNAGTAAGANVQRKAGIYPFIGKSNYATVTKSTTLPAGTYRICGAYSGGAGASYVYMSYEKDGITTTLSAATTAAGSTRLYTTTGYNNSTTGSLWQNQFTLNQNTIVTLHVRGHNGNTNMGVSAGWIMAGDDSL